MVFKALVPDGSKRRRSADRGHISVWPPQMCGQEKGKSQQRRLSRSEQPERRAGSAVS